MMRYAYLYFMKDEPERVGAVALRHAAYWKGRPLAQYLGGPFGDRSGGSSRSMLTQARVPTNSLRAIPLFASSFWSSVGSKNG